MTEQSQNNRIILSQLLMLTVTRNRWLVGMDTDGVQYRIVPSTLVTGSFTLSQRSVDDLSWRLVDRKPRPASEMVQFMLRVSVPVTGWYLVKGG